MKPLSKSVAVVWSLEPDKDTVVVADVGVIQQAVHITS